MGIVIHRGLPAEHPFYAVIGRIASEAAQLEHLLDVIIWEISGTETSIAACITSQLMGPAPRYRALENLCRRKGLSDKTLRRIDTLSNLTQGPNETRNRIVHDAWYVNEGSGKTAQFRAMPTKKPYKGTFGHVEIDQVEIDRALNDFRKLRQDIGILRDLIHREIASLGK